MPYLKIYKKRYQNFSCIQVVITSFNSTLDFLCQLVQKIMHGKLVSISLQFGWYNLLLLHDLFNLDNEGNKIAGDDPWLQNFANLHKIYCDINIFFHLPTSNDNLMLLSYDGRIACKCMTNTIKTQERSLSELRF